MIATSEVYSSKAACLNGVESVKKNAPVAAVEDQTVEGFATEKNPKCIWIRPASIVSALPQPTDRLLRPEKDIKQKPVV